MANRNFENVQAPETEVKIVTGYFVGVNGGASTDFGGCIASISREGEGDWDIVLTDSYPGDSCLFRGCTVESAADDHAKISAYDEEAKTLTVSGFTAGAADDLDAKRVEILLIVRNSTSRRGS
jgi:hypothetical protein